jgi:transcription-repair coupling factor (superfamily II helicase)
MLEEAVAELRGEPIVHDVDPEMTLDVEQYLPDDYIDDVGLRLSFYKRFSNAADEASVDDLATEMEDRFGPPPPPALAFVRAMSLRPDLRAYRVLGLEASTRRVAFHLKDDTPLDPRKAMVLVGKPGSPWKLTPDMKLTKRIDVEREGDTIDRVREVLRELRPLLKDV